MLKTQILFNETGIFLDGNQVKLKTMSGTNTSGCRHAPELGYLRTLVLVEGLGELVDRRRHLEALLQDGALALHANVARPLDDTREVALARRQVATDRELTRLLLE